MTKFTVTLTNDDIETVEAASYSQQGDFFEFLGAEPGADTYLPTVASYRTSLVASIVSQQD